MCVCSIEYVYYYGYDDSSLRNGKILSTRIDQSTISKSTAFVDGRQIIKTFSFKTKRNPKLKRKI